MISFGFAYNFRYLIISAFFLSTILGITQSRAQEVEEIVVGFQVHRLIEKDIFARYDGTSLYLPVLEIFSLLELNIEADFAQRKFSGFLISRGNKYEIDLTRSMGKCEGRSLQLSSDDYVITPDELYLRRELFGTLFGLDMEFSFSALQVSLKLNEEFPSYKRLKRKREHAKLSSRKIASRDIKRLRRNREYFGGGVLDWSISASPYGGGGQYYDLALGGMFLGGDFNVTGGGSFETGFSEEQLGYKWHYYLNDNPYLSQFELGDVYTSGMLARKLKGGLITNRPQGQRKFFQVININGQLEQNWEVELYINNQLADFAYTDYSGEYNFDIEINYGITDIVLKMYGPNGEILTQERHVGIPYSLVPQNTFEYDMAAGVSDIVYEEKKYAQGRAFYGITNGITAGISSDIPVASDDDEEPVISGELTGQIAGNLTANGSFAPGYASSIGLNYVQPALINVNGSYIRYFENRFRNRLNQIHALTFSASSPFKIGRRYLSLRYSALWNKFPNHNSLNMNYGFNTSLLGFYLNYMGRSRISIYPERNDHKISSDIFISPRFIRWIRPQLRILCDHSANTIESYGMQLNKRMLKTGQLSLSVERNEIAQSFTFMLTFRLLSSFADFSSRFIGSGDRSSITHTQRGSILYDKETHGLRFTRRNGVGYGAAVVRPFLDDNYNGILDENERIMPGLKARINGGREHRPGKGKPYFYEGLRAYDQYLVEIDQYSIDNPTLVPAHDNYEINCNPNVVTAIDVPLVTAAEISGKVVRRIEGVEMGQGGITVNLLNLSKESITKITTFSNGEFYYLGLVPGLYRAYIDLEQLGKYGYESSPTEIEFRVEPAKGGATIENINFAIVPAE